MIGDDGAGSVTDFFDKQGEILAEVSGIHQEDPGGFFIAYFRGGFGKNCRTLPGCRFFSGSTRW